jgi:hypothetical protein
MVVTGSGMTNREAGRSGGHRFLFAIALLASVAMCGLLTYLLVFFVGRHDPRAWKLGLFVLPQLALFGWVAREMWRGLCRR